VERCPYSASTLIEPSFATFAYWMSGRRWWGESAWFAFILHKPRNDPKDRMERLIQPQMESRV